MASLGIFDDAAHIDGDGDDGDVRKNFRRRRVRRRLEVAWSMSDAEKEAPAEEEEEEHAAQVDSDREVRRRMTTKQPDPLRAALPKQPVQRRSDKHAPQLSNLVWYFVVWGVCVVRFSSALLWFWSLP